VRILTAGQCLLADVAGGQQFHTGGGEQVLGRGAGPELVDRPLHVGLEVRTQVENNISLVELLAGLGVEGQVVGLGAFRRQRDHRRLVADELLRQPLDRIEVGHDQRLLGACGPLITLSGRRAVRAGAATSGRQDYRNQGRQHCYRQAHHATP